MSYRGGKYFEDLASGYLKDKGYRIISKNFKLPLGEIDVVAGDKDSVCFIEVKARTYPYKYDPVEAIDEAKKRKIIDTSRVFIKKYNLYHKKVRFDVLSVIKHKMATEFYLIKNAF